MKRPHSEHNLNLIAKILSNNAIEAEKRKLSGKDSRDFEESERVWQWAELVRPPQPPEAQWAKITRFIQEEKPATILELPARPQRRTSFYVLRIAAVLLLAILSIWTVRAFLFSEVAVATQNGERQTVQLPDGSEVELNAASRLTYSKNFAKKSRRVALQGEAFFQVRKNERPFVVRLKAAEVEVLGTSFNIRDRGEETTVVVARGQVAFTTRARPGNRVLLHRGEMSRIVEGREPSPPQPVDLDNYLAWRQGRLEFERTPLDEVFAELQRQFDVQFHFSNPNLNGQTLTASFQKGQSLEEILTAICLTLNWEFHQSQDVVQIENPGTQQ
ncbi:MAG: FecR family protein [bacterium]